MLTIQAALWSADCLALDQAQQLDEHSECLQCVPAAVRDQFLCALRYPEPEGKQILVE
jgi:hypothetical protein